MAVAKIAQEKNETADLGEVLARAPGVSVRRDAGLGSGMRFSLAGLYDQAIRFFLDGIPLDSAGYPFGIANVPPNLVDRVELYSGVVPIRFGADALGGAVNIISTHRPGKYADASYHVGSFATHRVAMEQGYQEHDNGFFFHSSGFFDYAKNSYDVNVQLADAQGTLRDATVPRFHDAYTASGVNLELGLRKQPWADLLSARVFYTRYDKQLQSNAPMTVPYGEVTYGDQMGGLSLRYEHWLAPQWKLDLVSSYARHQRCFVDKSYWTYDWRGKRIAKRSTAGEVTNQPHNDVVAQHDLYTRVLLTAMLPWGNVLRLVVTPSSTERSGRNRAIVDPTQRDPLSPSRQHMMGVSGAEWELRLAERRLQNIAFVKNYVLYAAYSNLAPGGVFQKLTRRHVKFGGGDALRFKLLPGLLLKASYEYSTRLPSTDELFGDGVLIAGNTRLEPEVSHNVNLEGRLEMTDTGLGSLVLDAALFYRGSANLIVLTSSAGYFQLRSYQNVFEARTLGAEGAFAWGIHDDLFAVQGSFTAQDVRNVSSQGAFGAYNGDRIPNRPWLFASLGARMHLRDLPGSVDDGIEVFYVGRFVGAFLYGWESLGAISLQPTVPDQISHDIGATYTLRLAGTRVHCTFEVDNLTNALLYDNYNAQRPGIAFYGKIRAEVF